MKYETKVVPAHALEAGDRFKMGGLMYQVSAKSTAYLDADKTHISAFTITKLAGLRVGLIVYNFVPFKIYNRKRR